MAASRDVAVARPLDFLLIGAAKSGTTSLFHYLRGHPRLHLPPDKEAPFFAEDDVYHLGWERYVADHFAAAPPETLWGKITPRYLGDLHVPARVAATMPDVMLLALLRNPVDRVFSKYRLLLRKRVEHRSFVDLVKAQLEPAALREARSERMPIKDTIVVRGEYSRLIDGWLDHFSRDRLLIHLTDELEQAPTETIDSILGFVGIEPGWIPPNLDKRYYVGGDRQRFPSLVPAAASVRPLRALWHHLPKERRRAVHLWFMREFNIVREDAPPAFPADLRARLIDFYRPDVASLERLIGRSVPWSEFAAATTN